MTKEGDKVKKKDLIFNEAGQLKGSLDTLDTPELSNATLIGISFKDEEGKKLVLARLAELAEKNQKWLESLSFPEKMKAYGHTFETLAEAYRTSTNAQCEFARRLMLIGKWQDTRKGPSSCRCSAMVWDQESEGTVVPYLYCVIKDGMKRLETSEDFERSCPTCEKTPCDHFWEPEYDSRDCKDHEKRKSKYLITPCVYCNPSDEDIDIALSFHEEEGIME